MRYGLYLPIHGPFDVNTLTELARTGEKAGWDGFFIWDHVTWAPDNSHIVTDTTVALTSIALATERMKFGALVTPLARRRPWKFAKETATLDNLSGGRLVVGVGLGEVKDSEPFGEATPPKVTASRLDEALTIVEKLWTGEPTSFSGEHFRLTDAVLLPRPVQQPRIPIWVAGLWPNKPPFRRAARWDGALPLARGHMLMDLTPSGLRECREFILENRDSDVPPEMVFFAVTQERTEENVEAYADAGADWWLEAIDPLNESVDEFRERIAAGPEPWR